MTIEVMLLDGHKIFPSYDPEHRKAILEFYADKFDKVLIMGWKVI